jgi:ABC-type transport system involved in multi-copper enzyme maturation permease subunit
MWFTLRQFRAQAVTALIILAAAAAFFVITGLEMHSTYSSDLATCPALGDCDDVLGQLGQNYNPELNLAQLIVTVAPALIGIFWGAPLIGRELESGTHQLAWNQSVTRTRWLAYKLSAIGAASIGTAALLGYLLTWWAAPLDQLGGNRFGAMTFSTRDIVPLAYAAFAFALGTAAGLLIRRTVPAMAVTLAVFLGIQILMPTLVRPNLLPSTTIAFPINGITTSQSHGLTGEAGEFHFAGLGAPQGSWILSDTPVENASDQPVQMNQYSSCFPGPSETKPKLFIPEVGTCLAADDLHESVTYQPASHYWPLQWTESGIFLALAGALSGGCFWWIRRREN